MPDVLEVETRLLRACKTLRALPDREARFFRYHSLWPAYPDTTDEAYGYTEEKMPRFRPSPADVSDFLDALAWLRGSPKRDVRLIFWRSMGYSYRWIATRIGRSHEMVRYRYKDVILECWQRANGREIATARMAAERLFSTRDRVLATSTDARD